jgi:DNA repair protein SbcD/Mre11
VRILHTSDWHLGHTLHGLSREEEHARFIAWLLDLVRDEVPDALIIAGDVFDTACPPARSERAFFDFLAEARRRAPGIDIVIVGGNHDSALRLESTARVLKALNVHVVGSLQRSAKGPLNTERLLAPLHDSEGRVGAWVAMIPFLRPSDLPASTPDVDDAESPLVSGVRATYTAVLEAARERRLPGQAIVTTGHCYMTGSALSDQSERKILGGNLHALPASLFPADVAYVALGHLHKAQTVGGHEHIRYCGSPIPLSLSEANYVHEVRLVELRGDAFVRAVAHEVPRSVDMKRLPAEGPLPLEATLELLASLPERSETDMEATLPYLEVRVCLDGSTPGLRRQIEDAVAGKAVRLIKLAVTAEETGPALAEQRPKTSLDALDPREVFERCHRRQHGQPPSDELLAAFGELLEHVKAPAALDPVPEPQLGAGAA